jgi:error-prone DNA polymerase
MINVVCSVGLWQKYRSAAQLSQALFIRGIVQNAEGVVTLVADKLETLDLRVLLRSRDFR